MKPPSIVTFIVVSVALFSQGACSRKKPVDANANSNVVGVLASEGDRSRAHELVESGRELYRTDQDEKAIAAFEEATRLDPDLAEAFFRLGMAYDAVGQENEAEAAYKKSIEKYKKAFQADAKDAEGHYNLGQAYAGLHLYSEAIREYRHATRLKADDSDIYYDLGMALSKLANYDEAVTAFSKSVEIDPENYRAVDGLEEAREGAKRIRAGKKHQEDLLKKQQKEYGADNANSNSNSSGTTKPNSNSKANSNSKTKPRGKKEN